MNSFLLKEQTITKKINRLTLTGSVEFFGGFAHVAYKRFHNQTLIDEGTAQLPISAVMYEGDGSIDIDWLNGVIGTEDFDNMEALKTWEQHLADQAQETEPTTPEIV